MLLFKNGLRKLLKDYVQFGIYLVLITIAVIFTSTFGIVSSNLISTNNEINRNFEKFDYSFRYTSSAYKSNDTQTFTPWFAFNTDLVKDDNDNYFPTLSFGDLEEGKILKSYEFKDNCENNKSQCYESTLIFENSSAKYVNFHFGDVESNYEYNNSDVDYLPNKDQAITNYSEEQKIETVKSGEFGDFYRFNLEAEGFKKSLIGSLYEKNNNFKDEYLTEESKKTALHIFDYMFYLNNSALTNVIKKDIIDIYNQNKTNAKEQIEAYINKGFGIIDNEGKYIFSKNQNIIDAEAEERKLFSEHASFYIKKFDSFLAFKTDINENGYEILTNKVTQRDWFSNYFDLLGDLTNFKIRLTNEAVKWDSSGKKFRYISSFYNNQQPNSDILDVHFYNSDIFKLYKRTYNINSFTEYSFISSSGYAKYNNLELGKGYDIFNHNNSNGPYIMDGIGVDSLNVYPTIYEEDLLTNQENEAIFYISNSLFNTHFNKEANEKSYQDVSRSYLTYKKSDKREIEKDINLFKTYFADNILNLGQVVKNIENKNYSENLSRANIEAYKDTTLLNMRSNLFPGVVKGFYVIAIIFCLIFASALAFVVYNIFKKVLVSQRSQIGNLKSLGVSNFKIISNYMLYMAFPILILVPIGWFISLFLQGSLMGIFERYFNIPSIFSIDWKLLLIELFTFLGIVSTMVFLTSYLTVKQSPLVLLAPSKSNKPNIFLSKSFSKIKGISFTSKLRLIILSTAIKDLTIFFLILLFSSSVITLASVAPNTMKNMSNEYYKNIKYNNDFSYNNIVINNPLTRYSFYQMDEENKAKSNIEASLFNTLIKTKENDYRTLFEVDYWKNDKGISFRRNFDNILFNNLLTFKGGVLSTGIMDELVNTESKISKEKLIEQRFNNVSCQVIPQLFGQPPITEDEDYNECIKSISNNILPSTIKELWDKDKNEFKNFSFNFSNISVDNKIDQMYTKAESIIDDNRQVKYTVYGLDLIEENSKNLLIKNESKIKYNDSLDYIPVLINKKGELEGLKVGNEFNLKTPQNLLAILGGDNSKNELDSSLWKFKDKNLFEMDLDKFTYAINHDFYFKNGSIYEPYYNMADIQLSLPKKLLNQELFDEVNDEYQQYSNKDLNSIYREDSDNYIVNPFDIYKYEDGVPTEMGIETLLGGTNSWLNIALKKGLLVNKIVDSAPRKAKVVGVEELYDGNKLYMDQLYANELMGVKESFDTRREFENGSSVNIWSNAKMSSNIQNADQMQRILLSPFNANNATDGFAKYMDQSIGYTDYIQMKKMAMSNLITSVISISVIFVSLSLITAIIIIYLITEMFIGRYKRFMSYMRIQGYSMREINSIIMWIFLPIAAIGVALGITIIWLLISYLVPQILLSLDIAVPMIMGWTIMPIVFIVGLAIFLLGYTVIMLSIRRVKLASLIGNE